MDLKEQILIFFKIRQIILYKLYYMKYYDNLKKYFNAVDFKITLIFLSIFFWCCLNLFLQIEIWKLSDRYNDSN